MDTEARMRRVAAFGERYREEQLEPGTEDPGIEEDPFRLRFLLKRAFAGAKPETLAGDYRECTETVLRKYESDIRARWAETGDGITDKELLDTLEREGVGNGYDRKMVVGIIDFLETFPNQDHDVIEHTETKISEGEVEEMFDELTDIYNIGSKKAALYLRDVVTYRELEDTVDGDQYRYLLPIDVWVHRVSRKLGILNTDSPNWRKNSNSIIEACGDDISPIAFDQGAWYLGANAFDVLLANLDRIEPRFD
jgi:hypothetical protein